MTEIHLNAQVICSDGDCGESTAVIVDPVSKDVTHVVVRYNYDEYLVPIRCITASNHDHIRLSCTAAEVSQMAPFKDIQFIGEPDDYAAMQVDEWSLPYVTAYPLDAPLVQVELVPQGELAIHRGDRVWATDGDVGSVGEFVIDSQSGHISHLVLEKGHLWGKKEVTLGLDLVDKVEEGVVYLKVDKAAVERLPAVKIKRHYPWQKGD